MGGPDTARVVGRNTTSSPRTGPPPDPSPKRKEEKRERLEGRKGGRPVTDPARPGWEMTPQTTHRPATGGQTPTQENLGQGPPHHQLGNPRVAKPESTPKDAPLGGRTNSK